MRTLAPADPIEDSDPFAPYEGRTSLRVETIRDDPRVMRTPLIRPVLFSCAWFGLPIGLILGLSTWWLANQPGTATWTIGVILGLGIGLAGYLVWLTGIRLTTYGIRLTDDGVWVFERSAASKVLIQSLMMWTSMRVVNVRFGNVEFAGNIPTIGLTYEQARMVLKDLRFPAEGQPSMKLARRIGL